MRPEVNISPNQQAIIREWADDHDMSVADAYAELLLRSLRSDGYLTNDDSEHSDSEQA